MMVQRVHVANRSAPVAAARHASVRQQRPCRAIRIVAAAGSGSGAPSAEELAAKVAEKERELQSMFEPGKMQPRAGVVAALRKEISTLRGQLQSQLGGVVSARSGLSVSSGAPGTAGASATSSISSSAAAVQPTAAQKRLLDALRLAEAQMAAGRAGGEAPLSYEEQQELLSLQEENASLKSKLDLVLARQAQLQQLWEQYSGSVAGAATSSSMGADAAPTAVDTVLQPATVMA